MVQSDVKIKNITGTKEVSQELNKDTKFRTSTFAKVRVTKAAPIQAYLDRELPKVIGTSFMLVAVEKQEKVDSKSGQISLATLYTVRVISEQAKAYRELVQIKIKNANPIITDEELDKVMLQTAQPIILRFENIAHYAYMGGETINASSVERLDISIKEAMGHE